MTDSPDEFDGEWLARFLARLSAFDRDMNTTVQDSGILAGAAPSQLAEAGKTPLVPGLQALAVRESDTC